MITAVRVELLKLRTTRITLGLLAAAAGLSLMIVVIESAQAGGNATGSTSIPSLATNAGLRDIFTNTGFAMLVATVFGAIVASGEYRHKTATDTYLDEPNRGRVLAAKVVAAALVGLLFGLVATVITTVSGLAIADGEGYQIAVSDRDIVAYSLGAIGGAALMAAFGVAVGALIRGQIGALIAVFVWCMAIESILSRLSAPLGKFLPLLSATTLAGANSTASMPPVPDTIHALGPGVVVGLIVGYTISLATVAAFTSVRKDVT